MKDNKILMILNEFPPTGQSGVQRGLKFLKYTVKAGWVAHVIAPQTPVRKITDYSLMAEIPDSAHIHWVKGLGLNTVAESKMVHARFPETAPKKLSERVFWSFIKLINDLLFPYDKQIGWMPFALMKAIRLINKHKIRNVYITAFPYSAFLVGIALKLIYGKRIFWVADYRDAWQFSPLLDKYVLPFRLKIITRTDDYVLRKCDMALFVTECTRERYIKKHPWLKSKSAAITNGYDEDDFKPRGNEQLIPMRFERFTFVYMGKIHVSYGNPIPLLQAIKMCNIPNFQFIHIGSVDKTIQDSIAKAGYDFYKFEGYKEHLEALSYSAGANINLIILSDAPESEHWFPGKLFELLRLGKPILAVGPKNSIIEGVLQQTQGGKYAYIGDKQQIKECIMELLAMPTYRAITPEALHQYSREFLTGKLLEL